jgi:hypothetical protein
MYVLRFYTRFYNLICICYCNHKSFKFASVFLPQERHRNAKHIIKELFIIII